MPFTSVVIASSEENIPLLVALVQQQLGNRQGQLLAYESYDYTDDEGNTRKCLLTHPLIQCVSAQSAGKRRVVVYEPLSEEGRGTFGGVYEVILSIEIDNHEAPRLDRDSYVIKIISVTHPIYDKPGKPSKQKRAINREQYLAKDTPLATHYTAVEENNIFYLYMKRAQGRRLSDYFNRLSTLDYLNLVIALLEQVPAQLMQELPDGKHQGKRRVHCDFKAENVYGDKTPEGWKITLVDFGNAKAVGEEGYLGKEERTTRISCDSRMLLELRSKIPTRFDFESDVYGLFILIAELAGYQERSRACMFLSPKDFLSFIMKPPNLNGLLNHMDMSDDLKRQLTVLIREMINDNRLERATIEQALTGFRRALETYQSTCPAALVQQVPINRQEPIAPCSFDKLIQIIEQALEKKVDGRFYPDITADLLCSRIQDIKAQFNGLNKADKERFRSSTPRFHSRYILDFFRFYKDKDIEACDAKATTRLLIRHAGIVNPVSTFYMLSPEWDERFDILIHDMPLQISRSDLEYCQNILEYKNSIHEIMAMSDNTTPLYEVLVRTVSAHLSMPIEEWSQSLPKLIDDLKKKYTLYQRVTTLLMNSQHVLIQSPTIRAENPIHEGLTAKINNLSTVFSQGNFSEAMTSLPLLENLISALNSLQENESAYQYPAINNPQSKYSMDAIEDLISKTNIQDMSQVNQLINTIEARALLFKITQILYVDHQCFADKYTLIKNKYTEAIRWVLMANDPQRSLNELSTILSHIRKIDALDNYYLRFNAVLKGDIFIQKAIIILTESTKHTDYLYQKTTFLHADYNQQRPNIHKLNADLSALIDVTVLEQPNPTQLLHLFLRFLDNPQDYQPEPEPRVCGHAVFWGFFSRVAKKHEDDRLESVHPLFTDIFRY